MLANIYIQAGSPVPWHGSSALSGLHAFDFALSAGLHRSFKFNGRKLSLCCPGNLSIR